MKTEELKTEELWGREGGEDHDDDDDDDEDDEEGRLEKGKRCMGRETKKASCKNRERIQSETLKCPSLPS